jgi:hypothetical protein
MTTEFEFEGDTKSRDEPVAGRGQREIKGESSLCDNDKNHSIGVSTAEVVDGIEE